MEEKELRAAAEKSSLKVFKKHKENPFLEKAYLHMTQSGIVSKRYKLSTGCSSRAVLSAVDLNTGEILGHTSFLQEVFVDEDRFAKIYLAGFKAFFALNNQAIRVLGYILTKLGNKKDSFLFVDEDCLQYTQYKSMTSIRKGLLGLLENEIIARGPVYSTFFINPLVVFNGNRLTFMKSFVKTKEEANPRQIRLFDKDIVKDDPFFIKPKVNYSYSAGLRLPKQQELPSQNVELNKDLETLNAKVKEQEEERLRDIPMMP